MYQLMLGALLALSPALLRAPPRLREIARRVTPWVFAGLLLVASSVVNVGAITRGVLAAALSVTLIFALETAPGGRLKGALSDSRVTYLGRISYGIYLWHWPVIVLVTMQHNVAATPLFVFACVIATALAALSYHLVEHPVRVTALLDRRGRVAIAGALTISLVSGLFLIPRILTPNSSSTLIRGTPNAPPGGPRLLDWRKAEADVPPLPRCEGKALDRCILVRGTRGRVLLVGDSHARMWIPAFESLARAESLTLAVTALTVCPWQIGLDYVYAADPARAQQCRDARTDWYDRVVPSFDPDVVVVVSRPLDDPTDVLPLIRGPHNENLRLGPKLESIVRETTVQTVSRLRKAGHNVVIIEPIPLAPPPFNPLSCLSSTKSIDKCAYNANTRPTPAESLYRTLAKQPGVWSLDLDRLVCPDLPRCAAVVDDVIVKRDGGHLTATFAGLVGPQLQSIWDKAGVMRRRPASK